MAIQTLNTIKKWFRTGLKPTQNQFWDTWDSFRHKSEKVPVVEIDGIDELLQNKTEIDVFENHLTDSAAHEDLFNSKTEKSQFDAHTIDPAAHEDLFNSKAEKSQFDAHIIDSTAHQNLFNGKEDKSQKGAENGYAPLNDFAKLASEYLNIVNDVVSGGTTSVLSAEQGKLLQNRIDAINTILTSDNVNLDTVQELVNAIESVQLSLNSILVNDLTTGGTTKALTAEMGKLLQTNKVDKAAGERLINAAEITKLSGLSNVTTTVKTILSTALATQNVAGFVTYINALSPVLVVGTNEIVKYTTSDTGRTFELNLRGRSFGVGQPAIVAANVLEITEFLNKDIRLSNYPNTRNDGQLATNKVLSTDVNGNLKMYTIATAPAPYLDQLIPDSYLPTNTGNFILKGAFFTPTMTVQIVGQTINYKTFINDNEVHINVTTGAAEGFFDVILNNGLSATFSGKMLIILGDVYNFSPIDFPFLSTAISASDSNLIVSNVSVINQAVSNKAFDVTKNWRFSFYTGVSPLYGTLLNGQVPNTGVDAMMNLSFLDVTNNSLQMRHVFGGNSTAYLEVGAYVGANTFFFSSTPFLAFWNSHAVIEFRYNASTRILSSYLNGVGQSSTTLSIPFPNNLKIRFLTKMLDIFNIKYVETA